MIPLVINIDYQDPESILMSLVQEPGLCFLDSAKQDKELGRFSYIAVDPFELINGDALASQPFEYLNQRLLSYQTESLAELPPFQGGALGYFGYDLLHHLEKIPQPTEDSIRIPSMMIGLYDLVIAFDHLKREAYLISQGFPEKDIEERQERARNRAEWLFDKIQKKNAQQKKQRLIEKESISSNFSKNDYCLAVQKVVDYIYAGDIFQANISQCFSCPLPDKFDLIALYLALRRKNPAPFGAYLKFDDLCIASASPERFIRLDQNKVQTRPIKGTRPRGQTPEQDQSIEIELMNSEKDLAENTMIVDLMRNDLSRVCTPDSIKVTQLCGLESYETVHHLVSVIEGELQPGQSAVELLEACFPGGSITGAPKIRAMEIISEIEGSSRGVYCGCIGYLGFDGCMDTSIVIRTYTLTSDRIYFQAGGGIVADSIPAEEYDESLTKAYALERVLMGEEI